MRYLYIMVLAAVTAMPCSGADDYKQSLIAQCSMYRAATGRLAPVYPALAKQIVEDYGIRKGVCVDVGSGCGTLAIELAKVTELTLYALDIDPVPGRLCGILVDEAGLAGRVRPVEGDAQDLPFRDSFADLVVSRGSIFFWPDQLAGVKEAYRILKPGGVAYLGGGFSRLLDPKVRGEIVEWRKQTMEGLQQGGWRPLDPDLVGKAKAAGVSRIRLIREPEVGWWIEIRK